MNFVTTTNENMKFHCFTAPRGHQPPDRVYRSRFNFEWWLWMPRLFLQKPECLGHWHSPRVIRVIWLCFAAGVKIGHEGPPSA